MELAIPDGNGPAERIELRPRVLDVVLALDGRARELENRRQHVAERTAARVGDGERACRIRGDELDLHALASERLGAAEVGAGAHDLVDLSGEPVLIETHVHEAAQVLHRGDRGCDANPLGDGFRDIARRFARLLRQLQRHVRRVVAVLRVAGPLHVDRDAVDIRPAKLLRGAPESVLYRGGDLVAEEHRHPRESGTANVRAPTSPLGWCFAKSRQVRTAAIP